MPDIPDWIEKRIEPQPTNKLSQRHVVETMLEADRPFFSIAQLKSRLKPDVGRGTVRNRLNELCEIDIVAKEEYPDTLDLYYINHPESNWPIPPELKQKLSDEPVREFPTPRGLVTFQEPKRIERLVAAGGYLCILLVLVGGILASLEISVPVESSSKVLTAAIILGTVSLVLFIGDKAVRTVRALKI